MGCWKNRSRKKGPGMRYHPDRFGGSSGNAAFDEYRAGTPRRLKDEQKEFVEFLERLRKVRDKAEFDQLHERPQTRGGGEIRHSGYAGQARRHRRLRRPGAGGPADLTPEQPAFDRVRSGAVRSGPEAGP